MFFVSGDAKRTLVATEFTAEDQYLITCSKINLKSMKQTAFLRCFLT